MYPHDRSSPRSSAARRHWRTASGRASAPLPVVGLLASVERPATPIVEVTIAPGYRFEATQALRQVLAKAVVWGLLEVNPAKEGVENPQRRRTEKRPFETWTDINSVAARLGPRFGPMVVFAAATGMRPGEMGRARAARH
jgi:integrase